MGIDTHHTHHALSLLHLSSGNSLTISYSFSLYNNSKLNSLSSLLFSLFSISVCFWYICSCLCEFLSLGQVAALVQICYLCDYISQINLLISSCLCVYSAIYSCLEMQGGFSIRYVVKYC